MTRERLGVLTISHEPLGFYRQAKETFFTDRAEAYASIARSMPEHIHTVQSASVWLDFHREDWQVTTRKNTALKRLISVWFYWMNSENWSRNEFGPSWYAIGEKTYQEAAMDKAIFIKRFGREEGCHFTSGDGLGRVD